MDFFERSLNRTIGYGTNTGAFFLVAVMSVICANVVFRIFGRVIPGTYDLVEIMIVVVAGFALSDTEIHHRQTSVDMITVHLPKKIRLWLENACHLIGLVYWGIIAWASLGITIDKASRGEATDLLKISVIPFRVVWVVGLILICLVIVHNMSKNCRDLMEPHGQSPWYQYSPPSPKDGYGETSAKGSRVPSRRSSFAPSPTGKTRGTRRRRMEKNT